MKTLPFHTLDVFTDTRFAGNPLAVVRDADGLSDQQMQTIAREFNLAETVFVQTSTKPAHTAKVRIFTPAMELPFAGHPTVGTAALLAELRTPETNGERDALVILELGIGTVRVGVRQKPLLPAFAEFDLPRLPERGGDLPPNDRLASALSLAPHEIGFENHRPVVFSAGVPYAFIPVTSLAAIERAAVRPEAFAATFRAPLPGGVYLYCRQTIALASAFHARMFWPAAGVPEDPATGSAAAAFAGVVHLYDQPSDGLHKKVIEQGHEMSRPSTIHLSLQIVGGRLDMARIGGMAVRVADGHLRVQDAVPVRHGH
jgi:trans-2,3-dihydro-3-hydroxyanthranilate isomerase